MIADAAIWTGIASALTAVATSAVHLRKARTTGEAKMREEIWARMGSIEKRADADEERCRGVEKENAQLRIDVATLQTIAQERDRLLQLLEASHAEGADLRRALMGLRPTPAAGTVAVMPILPSTHAEHHARTRKMPEVP